MEHATALEADWQAVYGRDLRADAWGPEPMGARRLAALVTHLPLGSAVHRATDPAAAMGWGPTEDMLRLVAQLVDHGNRILVAANSGSRAAVPPALDIPRPSRRRQATSDEVRAIVRKAGGI